MSRKPTRLDRALDQTFPASDPVSAIEPAPAADEPTGPLKADIRHIDPSDEQELRFWCRELDTTLDALKEAISVAGVEVEHVRRYLAKG